MTKALSKELVAVCMMSGVVLWIEKDRADKLEALLKNPAAPKFVEFEGQLLNTSSIEGVYSAQTMDELQRRKNGQWNCKEGEWHDRFEKCACSSKAVRDIRTKLRAARAACELCEGKGVRFDHPKPGTAFVCPCSGALVDQLKEAEEAEGKKR